MISVKNNKLVNQLWSNNFNCLFPRVLTHFRVFWKDASLEYLKDIVKLTEIKFTEMDLQERENKEISDVQKERLQHKYF